MTFCIITHVPHYYDGKNYWAYRPYVTEMNIWLQYVDNVIVVAPLKKKIDTNIDLEYKHKNIRFLSIPEISFTSFSQVLKSLFFLPFILSKIFYAFLISNHLHLRCPGNIGLIGCFLQVFFPMKKKTAKYAGNWDPNAKQPWSYNLQKKILANTFFTKNIKVLVYGKWQNQTHNIIPFFTATYSNSDRNKFIKPNFENEIRVVFVGTLTQGKQPVYALKLFEKLKQNNYPIQIDFFGEGIEKQELERYITENNLQQWAILHGNISKENLKIAYQKSHFLILPSKSEGWPKAVAEAMFMGCVPVATPISCVPYMLGYGSRGILLTPNFNENIELISKEIANFPNYSKKSEAAQKWSQEFTLEKFDEEIKKMVL